VHKLGYRFTGDVHEVAPLPARAAATVVQAHSDTGAQVEAPAGVPEGAASAPRTRVRAALIVLAVLVPLMGLALWAARARLLTTEREREPRLMLAVLPFENLGGDPQNEYLSDGLTEELIFELGRLDPPRLAVIGRTSAMHYKGTSLRLDQVGRELRADYVLGGSVRPSGDERVQVAVKLVQVSDQSQLWGREFESTLGDVRHVQVEVAQAVGQRIRVTQAQPSVATQAVDPEVYRLYLRGRHQLNKRNEAGFREARAHFEQAIDMDPAYAPAYAGLADTYVLLSAGEYSILAPAEGMPKAKAAALRALELDPSLAEAETTLAFVRYTYEWDWQGAEQTFQHALELGPNYATAHHWYALYLKAMGRAEAITEARRAEELDPLAPIIGADMAWSLYHLRRFDEAAAASRRVLRVQPDFAVAHWNLGLALTQLGSFDEAIAELQKAVQLGNGNPVFLATLGHTYGVAGRRGDALRVLGELSALAEQRYVSPAEFVFVHVGLGQKEEAFEALGRAYAQRSDMFVNLRVDPRLDPLRSDPRFQDLLRRMGYVPGAEPSASTPALSAASVPRFPEAPR
jgi:TolB-like protein/tetratricopeptide (TPR) repeat protein